MGPFLVTVFFEKIGLFTTLWLLVPTDGLNFGPDLYALKVHKIAEKNHPSDPKKTLWRPEQLIAKVATFFQ